MKIAEDRRRFLGSTVLGSTAIMAAVKAIAPLEASAAETKSTAQDAVKRLQAYEEIHNSVSRVAVAVNWRTPDKVMNEFALDHPDVSFEYADEGVFQGPDVIRKIVAGTLQPLKVGEMLEVHVGSATIEVARDLKSARALFWTPGYGAVPQSGGMPLATWNIGRVAADYVPGPDGSWKILHAHYFRFIECPYQEGFVNDTSRINRSGPMHPLAKATTYHHPYSALTTTQAIPAVPRPYDTYNGSGWMLGKA
jgi:hypothetical protein